MPSPDRVSVQERPQRGLRARGEGTGTSGDVGQEGENARVETAGVKGGYPEGWPCGSRCPEEEPGRRYRITKFTVAVTMTGMGSQPTYVGAHFHF